MSSKEKIILFGFAFLVKFSLLIIFSKFSDLTFSEREDALTLYFYGGDANDYIDPVENLLEKGKYYFGYDNYAGRMPGFAAVYLPFRLFFNKHIALNLVIVTQTILNCLSALFIFLLCLDISKNMKISFFCYLLFTIGSYISIYNNHILTESIAFSSLIFAIFHLNKFLKKRSNYNLILSGLFICWLIFLRPYMIITLILFVLILIIILYKEKYSQSKIISSILIFVAPFVLFDGLWIIRNAYYSSKFIPLQSSLQKGASKENTIITNELRSFICSFGGDFIPWHPESEGMWFQSRNFINQNNFKLPSDNIFPEKIFSEKLTIDTLKYAKKMYLNYWKTNNYNSSNEAIRIFGNFRENYKGKFPLDFYFISRLKILKRFLIHPYTYMLPYSYENSNIVLKLYKIVDLTITFLIIIIGLILTIFLYTLYLKKLKPFEHLVLSSFWIIILIFPIYFGTNEYRFLILGCSSLIFSIPIIYRIRKIKIE